MRVTPFHCGPFANESERTAFEHLKTRLESTLGGSDDQWILLTNLTWSVTHQFQADEIDMVAIGPPGIRVIEVKHWSRRWVDEHADLVEREADRVTNKARKIGTTSRKSVPDLGRVDGVILLTRESQDVAELAGRNVRGVRICTLKEWRDCIDFGAEAELRPQQVARLGRILEPKTAVALDGSLRRFAGYVNLERSTPPSQRFHRVYRGVHATRHGKVVLHLYDLSASDTANAETRAKREFDTLHRLQLHAWAPRVLDSWQPAPGYAGEMFFFTVTDPLAPSVELRASDHSWDTPARLDFARAAVRALRELHDHAVDDAPILHRNLTPKTVLVRHDNTPIFVGFELSRIPLELSVASVAPPSRDWPTTTAPEVRRQGLHAAAAGSDLYALCASLRILFADRAGETSRHALDVLAAGMAEDPDARSDLAALDARLSALLGESPPIPPPPPARFWTESQIVPFGGSAYRVVQRLGSGGVGTTFKVVQLDGKTKEEIGTYVAKVCHDEEAGRRAVSAYRLARSHLQHQAVSGIFEVATAWRENEFTALMTWVEGSPLRDFVGVLPLLVEDLEETSAEALTLSWLRAMCEALDVLHRNGLIHGDVNPGNLIVSRGDLVLTDYDFVSRIDEPIAAPGAVLYCSPSHQNGRPASPSDDLYALAASFFHVIFEYEPFSYDGAIAKERGLNWGAVDGEQRAEYSTLGAFLDRATHPDADRRYRSVAEALNALVAPPHVSSPHLVAPVPTPPVDGHTLSQPPDPPAVRRKAHVEWLKGLLQSYPGSRWGNRETRGLDSTFAEQTYVETPLETALHDDLRARRVRLVVLCGNAGDGKTALLQHLAGRFGLERRTSSERVLKGELDDGLCVQMNLDGSASWQGRSADDLLDEFLAPFREGPPAEDIAHLLAINDGRLLEWIERVERREGRNALTRALFKALQRVQRAGSPDNSSAVLEEYDDFDDEDSDQLADDAARDREDTKQVAEDTASWAVSDAHIRFVNLNQRSLVGSVTADGTGIETGFLERLVDRLYGGSEAAEIWAPCGTCSAQDRCAVFQANRLFGPAGLPGSTDAEKRSRARGRLFEALQAVHLRGETQVTVRELRATLVYILFGVHFCDDYHEGAIASSGAAAPLPYWDRAFDPESPGRQGAVLGDLVRFDPALDAHPRIDRHLVRPTQTGVCLGVAGYPELSLASGRRRAYFEWLERDIELLTRESQALELAHGRHLRQFCRLPVDDDERAEACLALCAGIARLATLPPQAYGRPGVVPLRITPRTPTETAFWIEKPADRFKLDVDLPSGGAGLDRLHRQAVLVYRYADGGEERLRLGVELFHLLMELSEGYQLGDTSTDDTFAHLSIFVRRLEREDDRRLLAWNPMREDAIHEVAAESGAGGGPQRLVIRSLA